MGLVKKALNDLEVRNYEPGVLVILFNLVLQYGNKLKQTFNVKNCLRNQGPTFARAYDSEIAIQTSKLLYHFDISNYASTRRLLKRKNKLPLPELSSRRGLKLP